MTPQEWMVAYLAENEPDAYIVAGRLEAEGIESWVYLETFSRVTGIGVGAMAAPKVLVKPYDYERAKAILNDDPELLLDDNTRIIFGDDEPFDE
jgi:hypothetical protein